ncbi:hypothetical protein [Actinokineospora pegani]|uniref:hypothetical protein n=1 Tax=Actinokineospora pegani TaxID=2654637 RepID=UPI0012EAD069|nr:hypothetical protein [Actinokineospora pegani]
MNDEDPGGSGVSDQVHTLCHSCGGAGMVADPKPAVIGGQARAVDSGRPCPHCGTTGQFPGIVPPV